MAEQNPPIPPVPAQPGGRYLRNTWYVAAWADDIDARPLARIFLEEPVALFRDDEGVAQAIGGRCPHRFAPLGNGRVVDGQLECPYHGLRFDGGGACVFNPHEKGVVPRVSVPKYPLVERHRLLWIWMGDPALADADLIPDHGHMDVAEMRPLLWHVTFAGNWQLGNDNLMELTHLFFLHTSTIGGWKEDAGSTQGEEYSARIVDGRVHSRTFVPDIGRPATFDNGVAAGQPYDQWNDTVWEAPANMRFTMGAVPAGAQPLNARPYMEQSHCITPETATSSHYFSGFTRRFELDRDEAGERRFVTFFKGIFEREDGPIMEDIQAQMSSSDLLAHNPVILPRDKGAILVRRLVAQRLASEPHRAQGSVNRGG